MSPDFQLVAGSACLDFINTLDNRSRPERQIDLVRTYADLAGWARKAGLIHPPILRDLTRMSTAQPREANLVLRRAIELRELLYRIFSGVARNRRPGAADLSALDVYLADAFSRLHLHPEGAGFRLDVKLRPVRLDSLLWPIVRSATELLTSPDLGLVRECELDTCRWLFVDRTKNHSRRWCDMKQCGNRVKARKFYSRSKNA